MRFGYCPFCGTKTVPREIGDEGEIPYCESCDRPLFDMFHTCVLCIVVNEDSEVALIRQSYGNTERFVGVAGFMKVGETPEEAARREVGEEIGLTAEEVQYIGSSFHERGGQLMLGMLVRVRKADFRISDELLEAKWFSFGNAVNTVREGSELQQFLKNAREIIAEKMSLVDLRRIFEIQLDEREDGFLLKVVRLPDGKDMTLAMGVCEFESDMEWFYDCKVGFEGGCYLLPKTESCETFRRAVESFIYQYRKAFLV